MSSSDSDPERKEPRESPVPPIFPEALLDVVQALGGLTSESAPQRDFALKVHKMYFEELPARFATDDRASSYLREVLAGTASAIRGFAVERTAFRAVRAREEKLEELRSRVTSAKFFHAPIDSEFGAKAYAVVVKVVGGTIGAGTLAKAWSSLPWWGVLMIALATLAWVFFGDLLFAIVTVRLQLGAYRQTGDTEDDIRKAFSKSVTSYKELALQLLVSTDRARERWYPDSAGLLGPIRWSDASDRDLTAFLQAPNARLGGRVPAEILSRLVDVHFGVRASVPLYRELKGVSPSDGPSSSSSKRDGTGTGSDPRTGTGELTARRSTLHFRRRRARF